MAFWTVLRSLVVMSAALAATGALAQTVSSALVMKGDTQIHDPSAIDVGGHWVTFQTGEEGGVYQGAILLKTSPDGVNWTKAGAIGKGVPKWTRKVLGYQSRNIWAPTISVRDGTYYLYYAVSMFGFDTSTIGLMTNTEFDPQKPGAGWQDQGEVITSHSGGGWNAIDPFRIDTSDGRAWLSYGSYWSGIKLAELDPKSGKLLSANGPRFDLASRDGGAIEASSLVEHDGKFYLFVSFDRCCAGVASTYRIMVGRADKITGPYLDKGGTEMMKGGATEVQATMGRYIGPGGEEPVRTPEGDALIYHYYDGDDGGRSKLEIAAIHWTADGWPELAPPP